MSEPTISQATAYIQTLFEERMRIKGATLERQVYKAGRKLPARVRKAAKKVIDANSLGGNPKLERMIDHKAFHKSARIVVDYLEAINPRDELIGRVLVILAKISTVLILGFVLLVWYLWSRGLV